MLHPTRRASTACVIALGFAACLGCVKPSAARGEAAPEVRDRLLRYARDTWHSFEALGRPGGLPADFLTVASDGTWTTAPFTSPTDIAAYLWSTQAADALRLIDHDEAGRRLAQTLETLSRVERAHGFFFNWYDAETGARLSTWPLGGHPTRPFLSSVDNGWLAAALMMVAHSRPELQAQAEALLAPMDFRFFYDPYDPADPIAHPGQLVIGYWVDDKTYTPYHYGLANTEPRIASYIGIARGDLPAEHYYRLNRTIPSRLGGREPAPAGEARTYSGVTVFEGHTTYRGAGIVPTWGGSMFEALMVPLFVPEDRWAPQSWGLNHPLYARAQVEYGLNEARYGYWGFSPSKSPHGGYREYGVPSLATKPIGYPSGDAAGTGLTPEGPDAPLDGVVTPHASFLALNFVPDAAMANLKALEEKFPAYGPFGFYDSVDVKSGKVSNCILSLDQGMVLAAIANHLEGDVLRHQLCDGQVETAVRPLIEPEQFTAFWPASPASAATTSSIPAPALGQALSEAGPPVPREIPGQPAEVAAQSVEGKTRPRPRRPYRPPSPSRA